jgi:hypothetical protein
MPPMTVPKTPRMAAWKAISLGSAMLSGTHAATAITRPMRSFNKN